MDYSVFAGLIPTLFGAILLVCLAAFSAISALEREPRAVTVACVGACVIALPWIVLPWVVPRLAAPAVVAIAVLGTAAAVAWFVPVGSSVTGNGRPSRRVDEREIMFARVRLKPGTPNHERYYAMHPEHRKPDDLWRALPGLLSPNATRAEPAAFAAAKTLFRTTRAMRHQVDGPISPNRDDRPAAEWTAALKRRTLELGARDVGVCALRPYHVYSHAGRGSGEWGSPVELDHRWAIAFTVEMDHRTMRQAPAAPVIVESARRYVDCAEIAIRVATEIRQGGYPARAHIDGNYQVIAPLVGWDAGLGELGRMGILITPDLGPRVRLGVVTTDVPLIPDPPGDDRSVIDFCTVCKKCADNCPGESIPFHGREPINDGLRWKIDSDSCFRYWNAVGSDCGRCMTVCPYSHPDNAAHDAVRWAIRRSGMARRGALLLDDLFYGRRPQPGRRDDHSPR